MARKMTKRYEFQPDYAVPPGATLQETIDALGMTQRDLALRTGLAAKTINEIVNGKAPITPETSILLERVTGVPARMWNSLEANYREQLARIGDRQRSESDLEWLKTIPTKELMERGAIKDTDDNVQLLHAVLQFFGVGTLAQWEQLWDRPEVAFRRSRRFCAEAGALASWLRLGEIDAQRLAVKPYDKERFQSALSTIRKLTVERCETFEPRMIELAAEAGVAVVFVRELKKCPVSGAARWLAPDKALIQLSLRYKTDDQLWFSFFHEASHVLFDAKKRIYVDDGDSTDEREVRADRFAAEFLIPTEHNDSLKALTTRNAIVSFASSIGIAPGIVVGRLQKEGVLKWATNLNDLKRRFRWKAA